MLDNSRTFLDIDGPVDDLAHVDQTETRSDLDEGVPAMNNSDDVAKSEIETEESSTPPVEPSTNMH